MAVGNWFEFLNCVLAVVGGGNFTDIYIEVQISRHISFTELVLFV